jgi:Uma2 family endonuclease
MWSVSMTTMMQELVEHPELIYRHTVDEYHEMIANGSIMEGEPYELLDGQIVRKIRSASGEDIMTVGVEHALIVGRLAKMSPAFESKGCHIRSKQPITVPPRDDPEPDAAIVRATIEDYSTHHPFSADVLCIIEVADSSLSRDRGYKKDLYARAGIPMYVIVNLVDRVVELYQQPVTSTGQYSQMQQLFHGQSISFPTVAGETVVVPVDQMFLR